MKHQKTLFILFFLALFVFQQVQVNAKTLPEHNNVFSDRSTQAGGLSTTILVFMKHFDELGRPTNDPCYQGDTTLGCVEPGSGWTYPPSSQYITFPQGGSNPMSVDVEHYYLYNVLPREMDVKTYPPTLSTLPALKAQALAARSIADWKSRANGGMITNVTTSQVFVPGSFEYYNSAATNIIRQAVDETSGEYLSYNGESIDAEFSNDIDNLTVAGNWTNYLISVQEPISPSCDLSPAETRGNGWGLSQKGAMRWAKGNQCAGSENQPWSVTWTDYRQILVHYYTGIDILDSNGNKIAPDNRWNLLNINHNQPISMNSGETANIEIQLQNTSISNWGPDQMVIGYRWAETDGWTDSKSLPAINIGNPPATITIPITAADTGGSKTLHLDVCRADTPNSWFSNQSPNNWPDAEIPVQVNGSTITATPPIATLTPSPTATPTQENAFEFECLNYNCINDGTDLTANEWWGSRTYTRYSSVSSTTFAHDVYINHSLTQNTSLPGIDIPQSRLGIAVRQQTNDYRLLYFRIEFYKTWQGNHWNGNDYFNSDGSVFGGPVRNITGTDFGEDQFYLYPGSYVEGYWIIGRNQYWWYPHFNMAPITDQGSGTWSASLHLWDGGPVSSVYTPTPTLPPTPTPTSTRCPGEFANDNSTAGSIDLPLLYRVKNEVLNQTSTGQHYVDLYYGNSTDIIDSLRNNPGLIDEGISTIQLWEPNLQALVDGNGNGVTVSSNQVQAIQTFLDHLSGSGSSQLQQTIADELVHTPLQGFVGKTMSEAAEDIGIVTAFPTTEVLDNFNRADGVIGSNWSGWTDAYAIESNQLAANPGYDIYWNNTAFGPDQEAYVTFSQVDSNAGEQDLLLKSQRNDSWGNGVLEVLYDASNHRAQVWTYEGWVQNGADIPVTFSNGDEFGARALADGTVEVYKNGVLVATRDVSSWARHAEGGMIGLWFIGATDAVLDDFGGGNSPASGGFHTTGVLDNFNRANGPIGSNWFTLQGSESAFSISANQLHVTEDYSLTAWKGSSFGADQEAYVTLTNVDTAGVEQDLLLKGNGDVLEVLYDAPNHRVQVWTSEGWVQHGADIPVTLSNGDQFGARALANGTVDVYRNGELLAERDITTWAYYANGGYIGMWFLDASNAVLDDFGGGDVQPAGGASLAGRASNASENASAVESQAQSVASKAFHVQLSNVDTFWQGIPLGLDQDAVVTFAQLDQSTDRQKPQSNGVLGEDVIQVLYDVPNQRIQVLMYQPGQGWVQYGNDIRVMFVAGDTFSVRSLANGTVEIYRNGILLARRDVTP